MSSYYQKLTPEQRKVLNRTQYLRHREKIIARTSIWAKNNKDKIKKFRKAYSERNPKANRAYYQKWRETNLDWAREQSRKTVMKSYYGKHEENKKKQSDWHKQNTAKLLDNKWKKKEKVAGRKVPEHCESCGIAAKLVFDHDHVSGEFRGWICGHCNSALGFTRDSVEVLEALVLYLKKYHPPFRQT